jgi:hypothetical protein
MAFDTAKDRIRAVERAGNALGSIRTIYVMAKDLQGALALYQAGTDPAFNAAFNVLFTTADRQELAAMINQLATLATDWETNHAAVVSQ